MRARIGTARMRPGGTSTSRSVAAIVIETFIGSGLPQTSAAALVSASAASTDAPGDAALARQRDHPLGARIDRLVQRMAVAGRAACAASRCSRATASAAASSEPHGVGARQHVFDQLAAKIGRAEDHRAAAEHAGRDRALKRGGIGVVGHARRLHGRRQAMLGERDQAEIEKEALIVGRRAAGREQEDRIR